MICSFLFLCTLMCFTLKANGRWTRRRRAAIPGTSSVALWNAVQCENIRSGDFSDSPSGIHAFTGNRPVQIRLSEKFCKGKAMLQRFVCFRTHEYVWRSDWEFKHSGEKRRGRGLVSGLKCFSFTLRNAKLFWIFLTSGFGPHVESRAFQISPAANAGETSSGSSLQKHGKRYPANLAGVFRSWFCHRKQVCMKLSIWLLSQQKLDLQICRFLCCQPYFVIKNWIFFVGVQGVFNCLGLM